MSILKAARSNLKLSAYSFLIGNFDFKSTCLEPPGTKIVAYIKHSVRDSWELNREKGWYVGPALEHYRCVTCYFPRSRASRIFITVTFFPTVVPFRQVELTDLLRQADTNIFTILINPPSTTLPSFDEGG